MDYWALLKEIGQGRVPRLLLLHGPEPFLLDDALAQVTRSLFSDPTTASLNRELLDARETTVAVLVRAALTLPFMAPTRLVAVKTAQALPAKGSEPLAEYAKAPNPSTCLLLLADERLKADGRERKADHWLLKTLPPSAVVEARPLSGPSLVAWLKSRAAASRIELSEEAARLLVQWVGEDLGALAGELEKAGLYASATNPRVDLDEVRAVVGEHRLRRTFELTRALEHRELGRALVLLDELLAAGEEPLAILGQLTRELRLTWLAKGWASQGQSADQVARSLRRPQHAAQALLSRATALSTAALSRGLGQCWETERRLKSGGLPRPEIAALLTDLCAGG
jgi:DNA polymerase-3 subunit delta